MIHMAIFISFLQFLNIAAKASCSETGEQKKVTFRAVPVGESLALQKENKNPSPSTSIKVKAGARSKGEDSGGLRPKLRDIVLLVRQRENLRSFKESLEKATKTKSPSERLKFLLKAQNLLDQRKERNQPFSPLQLQMIEAWEGYFDQLYKLIIQSSQPKLLSKFYQDNEKEIEKVKNPNIRLFLFYAFLGTFSRYWTACLASESYFKVKIEHLKKVLEGNVSILSGASPTHQYGRNRSHFLKLWEKKLARRENALRELSTYLNYVNRTNTQKEEVMSTILELSTYMATKIKLAHDAKL